jgi:hypothetical protein
MEGSKWMVSELGKLLRAEPALFAIRSDGEVLDT